MFQLTIFLAEAIGKRKNRRCEMKQKSYGFTLDQAGTVIIFQSEEQYEEAKTANPDLKLITTIGSDDLKDFESIVITQVSKTE